ncbi:Beta-glucosidase 42 [Linum perenne]
MRKDEFLNNNLLTVTADDYDKEQTVSRSHFPPNFLFGVATSAYQIEGGAEAGGRGPSIWDAFTHSPGNVLDGSNGDVAVDHYHRYKEDVELISRLGFEAYRFSISWSRIYPDGSGQVNHEGVAFYNNLINALLDKGIEPYATLYHWDLPLHLQQAFEGWLSKDIVKCFATYADTCFASFGDRVKNWITINEPLQTAINGHDSGIFAPGRSEQSDAEPYLASHHQILAHSAAVSVYRSKYKEKQKGQIGLVVDCEWAEPNSNTTEDKAAAARRIDFQLGWYLHPLYYGEYPSSMREILGNTLPKFSDEEKQLMLQNAMDFVGLNHYTSRFIAHVADGDEETHFYKAQSVKRLHEWEDGKPIGEKAASEWLYVCPWGLRKVLNYMAKTYKSPKIYITENGMDDEDRDAPLDEMLDDKLRVRYFKGYLKSVAEAIRDGVDVKGYFAWSLLDNFEWAQGYTKRFGIVYVDYKDGKLSRHPKSSAYWFLRFLKGSGGGGEGKGTKEE